MIDKNIYVIDQSSFTPSYDHEFCNALGSRGLQITLLTRPRRPGEFEAIGQYKQVRFFTRISEGLRGLETPSKILLLIKGIEYVKDLLSLSLRSYACKATIIHFQWLILPIVELLFLRLLRWRAKLVLTVHDVYPFLNAQSSRVQLIGWLRTLGLFDALIVHSSESKGILVSRGLSAEEIFVIPHGASSYCTGQVINEPKSQNTILLFGNLKHYKGADILVAAFGLLTPEERKDWQIRIVGRASIDLTHLQTQIAGLELENVVSIDNRFVDESEVADIFNSADVVAFPYRQIDASGVLFQSLSFGKPIIASKIGAFKQILRDRENALLFEPGDVEGLKEVLKEAIRSPDLLTKVQTGARELRDKLTPWSKVAEMTEEVYRSVL